MLEGRRVIVHGPKQAAIESFALDDSHLGPTEIVLQSHITLISPGTELARWQGLLGMHSNEPPTFPVTNMGYANIGTVLAAGAEARVRPGDRIYTMATHASLARTESGRSLCVPVPAGLPDERAVFVRLATVSMTTLRTTPARGGDDVAIVGLGLIGNLAAQVFQASGMRVHAFDLSPARRALAARCGLRSVHDAAAMPEFARRCRLVIEATGSAAALASAIDLAQDGGEIVMIGAPWGGERNSVPSSELTRPIFFRFLRLRSGSEWEIPRQPTPLAIGSIHDNSVTALEWLADGRLVVDPLVTHRLAPEAIQTAYTGLHAQKDAFLGVLLNWAG